MHGAIVNNLIYNPGWKALHYNLMANEWAGYTPVNGQMTAVGNVLRGGFDTAEGMRFLMIGGVGDLDYYGRDNIMVDKWGDPIAEARQLRGRPARRSSATAAPLDWPAGPRRPCPRSRSRNMSSPPPARGHGIATRTTSA